MSGMEVAGLALSIASVAALFTTCIECFDIVIAGKSFSEDYEQLCALFSLQRARFGLWGESVGLVPNPDGHRLRYDSNIARRDIQPGVERILNNIKLLLLQADQVDERYGLKASPSETSEVSTSRGINIFKNSFDHFKSRIRKNQKQKSVWHVTRWAIHDAEKFETMINRLEKYVDGLEKITDSLGRLESRLREEIDTIEDVESLRLLRDASSSHPSLTHNDVSDTASRRLVTVAKSVLEVQTLVSDRITYGTDNSFLTARSRPSSIKNSLPSGDLRLPGAWPRSFTLESLSERYRSYQQAPLARNSFKLAEPVEEDGEYREHYDSSSCSRYRDTERIADLSPELAEQSSDDQHKEAEGAAAGPQSDFSSNEVTELGDIPQHQRLLKELIRTTKPRKPLSFETGDAHYGDNLRKIKAADVNQLLENSVRMLNQAHNGSSVAKRMFFELRNIRTANVPFVSAVPVGDSLDKVLASIEGPPETPYEGGIFWITVRLPKGDVLGPPLMRFHTKVYHPNISPQGHICANYREKWDSTFSPSSSTVTDRAAVWYHGKSSEIHWSLGALLTAICGLLASPNVEDPLVPEIACEYLRDYESYCEAAKLYTKLYAAAGRPDESTLVFMDDVGGKSPDSSFVSQRFTSSRSGMDSMSLQLWLRDEYDGERSLHDHGSVSSVELTGAATTRSNSPEYRKRDSPNSWHYPYTKIIRSMYYLGGGGTTSMSK